ncbi:MBL fold metallo-hydrolase [Paucibacter sp. DJ2R-2]|uniref:MBL fold metallo-hydrolase n=1 Tax=Paucibacter sp. DJ2R-2 TaxID=2893558 RepID=UPI0021E36F0D|nr:MBL fold metallo-hydrolase [Paucibacter sp. DJ2R-2]MCV2418987.1 MBL fold metallo-hydrolase [Paucibacter sp. DJ4R-1]MCV2438058.1 MBL fold metallo-hydrolase [Paucibacter sp. DJ2R-2]
MPRLATSSFALAAALLFAGLPHSAEAAAPQVKTQAPGYYRMMLGDFEVTALNDGTVDLPMDKLLTGAKPGQVLRALQHAYLGTPLETSVNGYLINTGAKLVLVDTGAATLFGPTLGKLLSHLKAASYQPEQVDEIYITHLHGDHVGGLLSEGKAAFPNAVVRIDQREADYWLSEANMAKAPEAAQGGFKGAMMSIKPYQEAGRFKPFEGSPQGVELVAGVRAVSTYGHTPGHNVYVAESKGQKLAIWGDLMHVAAVQFPDPSVTIQFDSDSKAARPQREKAYADAAKNGYYVGVAHVAFPGIGRLRADGKGYIWVPANYSSKP